MKYKIIVDKQSRANPSDERKEYIIDIEELRTNGNVSDSLVITNDEDYVIRRLELTEYNVLNELPEEIKETIENVQIELFDGENYIYLIDMIGNKLFAEYLVQNDFIDSFATKVELRTSINQTNQKVQLLANEKLDRDEFSTCLEVNSEAVKVAWNKISDFIQMMVHNNKASLAILNDNNQVLATFDKEGQHFFDSSGNIIGDIGLVTMEDDKSITKTYLAFQLPIGYNEDLKNGMAWGIKTPKGFLPIFSLEGYKITENSDNLGGKMNMFANLDLSQYMLLIGESMISSSVQALCIENTREIDVYDTNGNFALGLGETLEGEKYLLFYNLLKLFLYENGSIEFGIGDIFKICKNKEGDYSYTFGNSSSSCYFTSNGYLNFGKNNYISPDGTISCKEVVQSSKGDSKYNIEKLESGIDIIKNTEIYKYNFKNEADGSKKHIGFVIGDKYKYSSEITAVDKKTGEDIGVDTYSMISATYKAIQEQQEIIEKQSIEISKLKDKISRLEGLINER